MGSNSISGGDTTGLSELFLKLCSHIGRNNPENVPKLYKIASNFLSSASLSTSVPSDEPLITAQISQMLAQQSKADVEKFELLYANICKNTVIQQRSAILNFLYNLAKSDRDLGKFTMMKELDKISSPNFMQNGKSGSLSSNPSHESIKSLFEYKDKTNVLSSAFGSTTKIQSSQATTVSSAIWSRDLIHSSSKLIGNEAVTEFDLLQDIIFSLQGIEGKYLKKEIGGLGFTIDSKSCKHLTPIQKGLVLRLCGTSFLHNQLKQYCESNEKGSGIICQALIATLRDELSSYYKTIAVLQTNMNRQGLDQNGLTLRRALFLTYDHHIRFEWLAYIAEQCSDKKGGALITAIHGFLQHGSKCAQEVSEKVLTAVCKPLYIMLSRWLLDGEINDPCNEFFIESRAISSAERLWYDKYSVRTSMVPSFITMEQAKKILATGKSINFLRQICKDGSQLPGRESLIKLFKMTSAEALFAAEQSIEFHETLDNVYRETSLRLLDLLKNKFRLFEHLQSLRRYLLLGQGDFIRHLMELLEPELAKKCDEIYGHTLTAILESAIRVTNAQFEDEDTLKRLNINFMGASQGDTGWDLFSLCYIVDGPVGTIFQPTMTIYRSLFGALWRAKRTEYVLANLRKQQITMSKLFRKIKELKPVMHVIHLLTSQMIHFLHQTQYYFLFEVLECSWAEMLNHVNKAEGLDDVIDAHNNFLSSVQSGVLLTKENKIVFLNLNSIYKMVLTLEGYQEALYSTAEKEFNAFTERRRLVESSKSFGLTKQDELADKERVNKFHAFLNLTKRQVKTLTMMYDDAVRKYLKLLSSSSNLNLQLLSVRLSFNDYYRVA